MRRMHTSFMALVVALGFAGCSSLQPKPPEEIIAERALAQARHLINSDYESALKYVVPSYQGSARARFYPADFSGSDTWTEAEVGRIRCGEALEPDRCEVRLLVYGGPAAVLGNSRGYSAPWTWDTVWIKIEGMWYQFLD